jgi:hypothetical protein
MGAKRTQAEADLSFRAPPDSNIHIAKLIRRNPVPRTGRVGDLSRLTCRTAAA